MRLAIRCAILALLILGTINVSFLYANGVDAAIINPEHGGHQELVHPFITHMGLPDEPGVTDVRINAFQSIDNGTRSNDTGFHIETGLWEGVGLHLRNDGINTHAVTELMLQAAVWYDSLKQSGLALFGEADFPTGANVTNQINWLYGVSGTLVFPFFSVDADIHHNIRDRAAEFEAGSVFRLTETIFPILEVSGELEDGQSAILNLMSGMKIKLGGNNVVGIGYRFPISTRKEFDRQLIMQWDMDFH